MTKSGRPASRRQRLREPKPLRGLREAIGLDSSLRESRAWHVKNGLADHERARWPEYGAPLELEDAPAEWFEEPGPLATHATCTTHPLCLELHFRLCATYVLVCRGMRSVGISSLPPRAQL